MDYLNYFTLKKNATDIKFGGEASATVIKIRSIITGVYI